MSQQVNPQSQAPETPTQQLLGTVQLTHIISILAILATDILVNYIYLLYNPAVLNTSNNVFFLVLFNVASVVGMAYYAAQVAVGLTGISIQTQPAIPTPATPLSPGGALSTEQTAAIGQAVAAYLQANQKPATTAG